MFRDVLQTIILSRKDINNHPLMYRDSRLKLESLSLPDLWLGVSAGCVVGVAWRCFRRLILHKVAIATRSDAVGILIPQPRPILLSSDKPPLPEVGEMFVVVEDFVVGDSTVCVLLFVNSIVEGGDIAVEEPSDSVVTAIAGAGCVGVFECITNAWGGLPSRAHTVGVLAGDGGGQYHVVYLSFAHLAM